MPSYQATLDIPKRLPIAAQVAESLRSAIERGSWKDFLPSERHLSQIFQVSRPTMHTALHLVAKDGLIQISQGKRNRLLFGTRRRPAKQNQLVGLIMNEAPSDMHLGAFQSISEMRAYLAKRGFATEILNCQARKAVTQQKRLEEFMGQNRVFFCVLISVSLELQQWFVAHSIPSLLIGSCHASVRLPSLDLDYRSVCRHAAGIFLSKGHKHIALVVSDSCLAGDLASEQGFREAKGAIGPGSDIKLTVVRHNNTVLNIHSQLDALFDAPSPPTALLVAKVKHVLIVLCYLLKQGLSVPGDVSIISRDQDSLLDGTPIAHYRFEEKIYNHRLIRLMHQLSSIGHLPLKQNLIYPRFIANSTVKRLR